MSEETFTLIRHRPVVHQLCYGVFLQEPLVLTERLLAIPRKAVGFAGEAKYTGLYAAELTGEPVQSAGIDGLEKRSADALAVVSLVSLQANNAAHDDMEKLANPDFERARNVISWLTGNDLTPFAYVIVTNNARSITYRPQRGWSEEAPRRGASLLGRPRWGR